MRLLTTTALVLCLPSAVFADDILLRADIAEALVFSEGAEVTRRAEIDLPQGSHTLLIPMRDLSDPSLIELRGPAGVEIGVPQPSMAIPIPEGALDTDEQAAARANVEAAEDALQLAQDVLDRRDAEIRGLETQLAYLTAVSRGGQDGAAMPTDPGQLADILAALGTETSRVGLALQTAREARRADEDTLADRTTDLRLARRALDDLSPFGPESPGILVAVDVAEATSGALDVSYPTSDIGWRPSYALRLNTVAEQLSIERSIVLSEFGAAVWRDVAMRFSTAIPNRQRIPANVFPDPVRIAEPAPAPSLRDGIAAVSEMEAMVEPVMLSPDRAQMIVNGLSVTYDYEALVSVGTTGQVTLPFDTLSLDIDLENRAIPRVDRTAFLVAMGENTSGEPILPGLARFYRDGDLMGTDPLPLIPPGAEVEMAFGPLDHLQLTWQDLSLNEGDRGIFVSENEQERQVAFTVENTSTEVEIVRLLYAAPFAEQEDLEVNVQFSVDPSETNVDDLRGVAAWDLTIQPGEVSRIEMNVDLTWPDEMMLTWQP